MSIYSIAVDFFNLLLGNQIAETTRGALFAEYFGYFICGLTIYLLIKSVITLISWIPKKW